jgi:ABC-2 type transport system ATP-binding protein
VIRVSHLTYEYPGLRALDDVSFELAPLTITALVGPNGAGKTTLMRCMAALDTPLAGTVEIDGLDAFARPREVHRRIGYLPDFFGLYDELTVRRCLRHRAATHGIEDSEQTAAVDWAAELLDIGDRMEARAGELSRGLRQRLAIAQAVIHRPRVLILDEPASGLDPEARHSLSGVFTRLRDEGMTLLVSSHILSELADYCSHMLVLREGRLREHRAIEAEGGGDTVQIEIRLSETDGRLADLLEAAEGAQYIALERLAARFRYPADEMRQRALLQRLVETGIPVCEFRVGRVGLQEAYLAEYGAGEATRR